MQILSGEVNMKWLVIIVLLAIALGAGWVLTHKNQAEQIETNVQNAATQAINDPYHAIQEVGQDASAEAIQAEIDARQERVKLLKMWIEACKTHTPPAKMAGDYDG